MGMIVPQYWAEARAQHRARGKQATVRRFGWSDHSQQDAQRHADERVQEAMARVLLGESLPRHEPKVAYNGAEGVPIREEIIARHGDAIVTRNSYGALCLNTPDVLFVDIDFDDPGPSVRLRRMFVWPLLLVALAVGIGQGSIWKGVAAAVVALIIAHWLAARAHRYLWNKNGGPQARAQARIDAFLQTHPDWHFRKYRTPAGLRLLAMHRTFAPDDPAVKGCFSALGADTVYALMCERQHCFRARVSPKPWRIGIGKHLGPRPGVWPIRAERLPDRQKWVAGYERRAVDYASCQYLGEQGSGAWEAAVERIRALHDEMCQVERGLPLA